MGGWMAMEAILSQADVTLKQYVPADSVIRFESLITGIVACKLVYELAHLFSIAYFKSYPSLSKIQRVEWKNRVMSTVHSVYITIVALYFVFWSDVFSDRLPGLVTLRSSPLSNFSLGGFDSILAL